MDPLPSTALDTVPGTASGRAGAKTRVRGINIPWEGGNWASTLPSPGTHPGKRCDYGEDASGVPEGFLYENQLRPVAWLDGAGTVKARFIYGLHVNVPEYMVVGSTTYRIVTDHLGSPRLVVDTTTGTVAQRIDYDEWGVILADSNPGFQPFGFAGGLWDRDTGLVKFGARDYDPSVGRWTNKDPVRFRGGLNLYGYVGGNPIDNVDPMGLSPADVQKILDQFHKAVQEMNNAGQRTDPGWVNNWMRNFYNLSFGLIGHHYLGCGEQALVVQGRELELEQQFDDYWTFTLTGSNIANFGGDQGRISLAHWWVTATSSNPADPRVVLDPWRNIIITLPNK